MFKKSRRKIVAAILSVLVLLLCGTFCIIYLASYAEMTNENRRLLEQYVDAYTLPGMLSSAIPTPAGQKMTGSIRLRNRPGWSSPLFIL